MEIQLVVIHTTDFKPRPTLLTVQTNTEVGKRSRSLCRLPRESTQHLTRRDGRRGAKNKKRVSLTQEEHGCRDLYRCLLQGKTARRCV